MFNKQNGYEGELSLVANEVKKKKKSYAVQKKKRARLVVIGIRGWKETAIHALSHIVLFYIVKKMLS